MKLKRILLLTLMIVALSVGVASATMPTPGDYLGSPGSGWSITSPSNGLGSGFYLPYGSSTLQTSEPTESYLVDFRSKHNQLLLG